MSTAAKLQGSWTGHYAKWAELVPEMAELEEDGFEMLFDELDVTFDGDSFAIRGYGAEDDLEGTYTVTAESDTGLSAELYAGGDTARKALWEIEFGDDDHIVMRMTAPKEDIMALQRT